MKPITPSEVKAKPLPEAVIDEWNKIISEKWDGERSRVLQNDIVERLRERMGVDRNAVFVNHWLDVESLYESVGWQVSYDKPAYFESYEAFFLFKHDLFKHNE